MYQRRGVVHPQGRRTGPALDRGHRGGDGRGTGQGVGASDRPELVGQLRRLGIAVRGLPRRVGWGGLEHHPVIRTVRTEEEMLDS